MDKEYTAAGIALRIWFVTGILTGCIIEFAFLAGKFMEWYVILVAVIASLIGSIPAAIVLGVTLYTIKQVGKTTGSKLRLLFLLQVVICSGYGGAGAALGLASELFFESYGNSFFSTIMIITIALFACNLVAVLIHLKPLASYFSGNDFSHVTRLQVFEQLSSHTIKTNIKMETQNYPVPAPAQSNRILYKGLITGGLILLMLIPTLFITNLIEEREARQKEVVKEVSSKWASEQTLSGPFLTVPYKTSFVNSEGKTQINTNNLVLLANNLTVNGDIDHEERPRSIYKVLLYKAAVDFTGAFKIKFPADLDIEKADFSSARLCFALSDYKGIEEEIFVNFNGEKLLLAPGLPVNELGSSGLSVPVSLSPEAVAGTIPFSMKVKIKGSEQLHFMPLSANSKFIVNSAWPSPSFDGNSLPGIRNVNGEGFSAEWNFNQANLPFSTVAFENAFKDRDLAFGVSFVQPADQYNKTMRSVKYAILFIGLTFAFFFIIELMQKKPFHPVQYVLVGLALVIFYTLLLSFSEYILFDYAYAIAALATVLLITFYAKGHFQSWGTAGIFFGLLSALYSFIFILIRLQDTALLVGSIGLFVVLALVMYASRKINWYGPQSGHETPAAIS